MHRQDEITTKPTLIIRTIQRTTSPERWVRLSLSEILRPQEREVASRPDEGRLGEKRIAEPMGIEYPEPFAH